jgi:hypothetical protein
MYTPAYDGESRAYLYVIVSHVVDVYSAGYPTSSLPASHVLAVACFLISAYLCLGWYPTS